MTQDIEYWARQSLVSEKKLVPFKNIWGLLQKDESLAHKVWSVKEFPLVILQVLTDSYGPISSGTLSREESGLVLLCMDILRVMVRISECKEFFLEAQLDYYLYPFILMPSDESLRIATIHLFCSVLREGKNQSVHNNELLPLLLKVVDTKSEELQLVALEAIDLSMSGSGLDYAVQTIDRFQAMDVVLSSLISRAIYSSKTFLLKKVLRIYLKLCAKANVREKLREKLPEGLDSKEAMALCASDKELSQLYNTFVRAVGQA